MLAVLLNGIIRFLAKPIFRARSGYLGWKFSRARGNIQFRSLATESAYILTILVHHKVPWARFPQRNRLKTVSFLLSSEHTDCRFATGCTTYEAQMINRV